MIYRFETFKKIRDVVLLHMPVSELHVELVEGTPEKPFVAYIGFRVGVMAPGMQYVNVFHADYACITEQELLDSLKKDIPQAIAATIEMAKRKARQKIVPAGRMPDNGRGMGPLG